jgi:hypothetical protein
MDKHNETDEMLDFFFAWIQQVDFEERDMLTY